MAKEPAKRSKKAPPKRQAKKKRAKRPSTKKSPTPAYNRSRVTAVELPAGRSPHVVRHEAGLRYIYDTNQNGIEWWHEQHYSNEVSLSAFRTWCADDNWVAQRESHWEQVFAAVARELAGEMTQRHIDEAKELVEVRQVVFNALRGVDASGAAAPLPEMKSYEGMAAAFVRIDDRLDKKRENLLGALPLASGGAGDGSQTPTGVSFSPEEYRAMASAVIKERAALPASTESPPTDVEEDDGSS